MGHLILNADDWGYDQTTTDRILDCISCGTVSSVSGMVFMKDSERAAAIAGREGIDVGLHLNLTTPFTATSRPARLREKQREIAVYLLRSRLSRIVMNPRLAGAFDYVVKAQREEFCRLYGREAGRLDGHHHMHLSANILLSRLLPSRTVIRRHFSYELGEKRVRNSFFRRFSGLLLNRRHRLVDYFFSLTPIEYPDRLRGIFSLAQMHCVEVETHPANANEYQFLVSGEIFRYTGNTPIAPRFATEA